MMVSSARWDLSFYWYDKSFAFIFVWHDFYPRHIWGGLHWGTARRSRRFDQQISSSSPFHHNHSHWFFSSIILIIVIIDFRRFHQQDRWTSTCTEWALPSHVSSGLHSYSWTKQIHYYLQHIDKIFMMMTAVSVDTVYSTGGKYRQDVCAWQNQKHLKWAKSWNKSPKKFG